MSRWLCVFYSQDIYQSCHVGCVCATVRTYTVHVTLVVCVLQLGHIPFKSRWLNLYLSDGNEIIRNSKQDYSFNKVHTNLKGRNMQKHAVLLDCLVNILRYVYLLFHHKQNKRYQDVISY